MRKQAINNLYRRITAAAPELRAIAYFPEPDGGGRLLDGRYVDAAEMQEMTAAPNILILKLNTGDENE